MQLVVLFEQIVQVLYQLAGYGHSYITTGFEFFEGWTSVVPSSVGHDWLSFCKEE